MGVPLALEQEYVISMKAGEEVRQQAVPQVEVAGVVGSQIQSSSSWSDHYDMLGLPKPLTRAVGPQDSSLVHAHGAVDLP